MYSLVRHYVDFKIFKRIHKLIRCYSLARKSHYEVLKVNRNCSDKDIKEAFIKLSKEYHPDKNKDADPQHFVRIVEAYNVLGKPGSRSKYDSSMRYPQSSAPHYKTYNMYNMKNSQTPPYNKHYDFSRTESKRKTSEKAKETPYYGNKGINRVPHYVLILICIGIAFVGTMLQYFVIREMYVVNRRQALERDIYLSKELEKVRNAAKENTNDMHTRILMEKIVGSANPTIATASLGQALATEKKETSSESSTSLSDLVIVEDVSNEWWENSDAPDHVTLNDIFRKLRMYYYYYRP